MASGPPTTRAGQVEADLDARRIGHTGIGGAERFETAALIADEVVAQGGPVEQAVVALGARADDRDPWSDALAASNLAAARRAPIVLVTPDDIDDSPATATTSTSTPTRSAPR